MGSCEVIWGNLRKQRYTLDRALQESRGNSIVGLLDEFYSEAETRSEIKALSDTKQVVTQIFRKIAIYKISKYSYRYIHMVV